MEAQGFQLLESALLRSFWVQTIVVAFTEISVDGAISENVVRDHQDGVSNG